VETKFVILEPKPFVLDRDALSAVEAQRLREEQRRHDLFFEKLARRTAVKVPPVRVL